jgi:ribosome-associated protein
LRFDLMASLHLSTYQKQLASERLSSRLTKDKVFIIKANTERSQIANRRQVEQRFRTLLQAALIPPKRRKKPRPPRRFHEKRLEQKKRRSEKKQGRGGKWQ